MSTRNLKNIAIFIAILLGGYFVICHTGFVITVIGLAFLISIGSILLWRKITNKNE